VSHARPACAGRRRRLPAVASGWVIAAALGATETITWGIIVADGQAAVPTPLGIGQSMRRGRSAPSRQAEVAAVASLGSLAMARMKFRLRRYVSGLTLFTYVIPSSFLAMVTFASPYALWVLSDYARSLPPEIEEAGAIGTYAFLHALLLLTGEKNIPIPVAMSNFLTTDNAPWNLLMAVSTVYSIPPVILYYCFKRYLVSGLVSGAVSGSYARSLRVEAAVVMPQK